MTTSLHLGAILPARQLHSLDSGASVTIGPHRTRAQVVVVTHPQPCAACVSWLASLRDVVERVTAEKADVLAVVGTDWAGEDSSLPIPAFVGDEATTSVLSPAGNPPLVVAERFGQVFACVDAGPEHQFPAHAEILTTLLNIAISCPECGVPDVPCLTTLPDHGTMSGGMRIGQ